MPREASKSVQGKVGLLPLVHSCCEHGSATVCRRPERYWIYLPWAISDLSYGLWGDQEYSHTDKLGVLEQALRGLAALHDMGIMHRDIRPENMLRLPTNPPGGVICDYGKAKEAESSRNTSIGPIHTLAPEVWTATSHEPYRRSIDVWAFGYATADILGCLGLHENQNPKITRERQQGIFIRLLSHRRQRPEDHDLVNLALAMMEWDHEMRVTAAGALQYRCWDSVRSRNSPSDVDRTTEDVDDERETKRHKP